MSKKMMDHKYNWGTWYNTNCIHCREVPIDANQICAKATLAAWLAWEEGKSFEEWWNGWKSQLIELAQLTPALNDAITGKAREAWLASTKQIEHVLLPLRDITSSEHWLLMKELTKVIAKHLGISKKLCPVGSEGRYPVCDECLKLHNACFTDPWCIDHG